MPEISWMDFWGKTFGAPGLGIYLQGLEIVWICP